jgi:hypothetical protein
MKNTIEYTGAKLEKIALFNSLKFSTHITGTFTEEELFVVNMDIFKTAVFKMNNETFNYTFSHCYNAATDKISKRLPRIFTI